MSSTVDQIISRFQGHYQDCSPTDALTLFQTAHREILTRTQVRNTVQYVNLVAGQRQCDISVGTMRIHEAYYERSSDPGDWLPMIQRNTDWLIATRRGWQATSSSGEPIEYYITSAVSSDSAKAQIGFVPFPATSTGTTYPRVALYTTEYADLSGSETVPSNLLSDLVYIYLMCRQWAGESHTEDYAKWDTLSEREMEKNVQHIKNLLSQDSDQIVPSSFFISRAI